MNLYLAINYCLEIRRNGGSSRSHWKSTKLLQTPWSSSPHIGHIRAGMKQHVTLDICQNDTFSKSHFACIQSLECTNKNCHKSLSKGKYRARLEFQEWWGVQTKTPSVREGGGYGSFLEPHINCCWSYLIFSVEYFVYYGFVRPSCPLFGLWAWKCLCSGMFLVVRLKPLQTTLYINLFYSLDCLIPNINVYILCTVLIYFVCYT